MTVQMVERRSVADRAPDLPAIVIKWRWRLGDLEEDTHAPP
jgi:hypothetical protein